jgi:hypothetical protein
MGILLFCTSVDAQKRVIDAVSHAPVAAASIFDATGNMIGFTWSDGEFSDVPESAYPVTLRCMGYEQLVIERPEDKTWEMTPMAYELEEVVIVPVKRNVLKQTFYLREYFSMSSETDTVTFFREHMADRFVPTSKDAKFGGDSELRILKSREYAHFQLFGEDSITTDPEAMFPSMATIFGPIDKECKVPESFKEQEGVNKLYEKSGKSGTEIIIKQNDRTFTYSVDALADKKEHKISPWPLKLLGFTMDINQVYVTQAYRVNDKGVYQPKDLLEASFVIQADGRGKFLRKALKSDKPIIIRCLNELYVVDRDYLSKEEAKDEYKNKPTDVKFVIPSTVPPLNEATRRMVERANAEAKTKNSN